MPYVYEETYTYKGQVYRVQVTPLEEGSALDAVLPRLAQQAVGQTSLLYELYEAVYAPFSEEGDVGLMFQTRPGLHPFEGAAREQLKHLETQHDLYLAQFADLADGQGRYELAVYYGDADPENALDLDELEAQLRGLPFVLAVWRVRVRVPENTFDEESIPPQGQQSLRAD